MARCVAEGRYFSNRGVLTVGSMVRHNGLREDIHGVGKMCWGQRSSLLWEHAGLMGTCWAEAAPVSHSLEQLSSLLRQMCCLR